MCVREVRVDLEVLFRAGAGFLKMSAGPFWEPNARGREAEAVARLAEMGVDGIVTNDPRLLGAHPPHDDLAL